jgi:hypothetical protein
MVTSVASFTSHFRADEAPPLISEGVTEKRTMDGGGCLQEMADKAGSIARLNSNKAPKIRFMLSLPITICLIIYPNKVKENFPVFSFMVTELPEG